MTARGSWERRRGPPGPVLPEVSPLLPLVRRRQPPGAGWSRSDSLPRSSAADRCPHVRREHSVADIDAFVKGASEALVAELSEWCAIPSISTDPAYALEVRRSAEHLAGLMETAGLHAEVLPVDGGLPVNLKFFVEGEEEAGSPGIDAFLAEHADRLACDLIFVSDTGMYAADVPSLVTAMRGLMYFQVDLRTATSDLHSGEFGGTVPNAVAALVELLSKLKDADGRIAVPGWYDDVLDLTEAEQAQFAALPFDAGAFQRTAGVLALPGERGWSPLERIGGRPSADVCGVWGGYTGIGSKTVIPAEAHAKLSFRLVSDQDPSTLRPLFERWVTENAPEGAEVGVQWLHGVKPCRTPLDHPGNQAARRAVARAWGIEPLFTREGGSGPERALSDALDASCVYLGVMLPEDHIHAPNERLSLTNYFNGIRAAAYAYEEFARPEVAEALLARRG